MNWQRTAKISAGMLLALVVIGAGAFWVWRPWVPKVEVADPGPTGRRVTDIGLLANYFPGVGPGRGSAILLLGGSEGGLAEAVMRMSLALQREGYSVLQLSYFRGPGQSPTLENGLSCKTAVPPIWGAGLEAERVLAISSGAIFRAR